MKKNKRLWITVSAAAVLIAAVVITAALLVAGQKKTDRYYAQMRMAESYTGEVDYGRMIGAYKAAIDIKPEAPEAYVALAEVYMDMEDYTEAAYIAELGFLRSGDETLKALVDEVALVQGSHTRAKLLPETVQEEEGGICEGDDTTIVSLRYGTVENVASFCYQEYISAYGLATVKRAGDEGYEVKFKGFGGRTYFKNTPENKNMVDEVKMEPAKNVRPYKVVLNSPQLLFVGYNDYISSEKLGQFLNAEIKPVYDSEMKKWFVETEYMACRLRLETDAVGNMGASPLIELYPENLVKEEWAEETETEETEEVRTFALGGNTYTYDVTSIVISGENIGDLSPLSECKDLNELVLVDCTLGSLDPLSGCTSLVTLDLRWSTGFSDLSPLAGLESLLYLDLHGCADVSDISPIMNMPLKLLHTCETGVSYEQTRAYKDAHPDCEVWWDNHTL